MDNHIADIKRSLKKYDLELTEDQIGKYIDYIQNSQQYFPLNEERALTIKLLNEWKSRRGEKIITVTAEACNIRHGPCITTFGVLSVDWPGLSDTCIGIIHEMGWNIYFAKGISMVRENEELGIMLIGVRTDDEKTHTQIINQRDVILNKIRQAAVGTRAKTYLLSEEIRKLEFYSQVITHIEQIYSEEDLEKIIGMNGEAVKFFAARSRDYLENRKIGDIADQILRNFSFIKLVQETGSAIQLDIRNFTTNTEGTFTGVTVAGPAHILNLEDCLKTIELTNTGFQLKHNREFTTEDGISVFRIEFVDANSHALTELDQKRLKKAFSTMVLNKRRDRAQWIESIGGFEQYARAIIPLLVKEAQSTCRTQVYISVGHTTDLYIDFKVIVVLPQRPGSSKNAVTDTVNELESVHGIHILRVKPPKAFGTSKVFIIDLRASLTDIEDTETIYQNIKEKVYQALGEFRDFDEGMRTIDTTKLKEVRRRIKAINKNIVRELYYSIEDFYRVGASIHEIIAHIRIALAMLKAIAEKQGSLIVLSRQIGAQTKAGEVPSASIFCISFPHEMYPLQEILGVLEPYEVTLSRLEKMGRDILICRVTENDKGLSNGNRTRLVRKIQGMMKRST